MKELAWALYGFGCGGYVVYVWTDTKARRRRIAELRDRLDVHESEG